MVVLVVVWAGLAAWQWFMMEEPVRVPLTNVSGPASAQQGLRGAAGALHVQLELLASSRTQREMSFLTPRNIFAFPSSVEAASDGTDSVTDTSQQQHSIAAELAQFHYLGYVRAGEDWEKQRDVAVLTKNDDLHVVRKGETVENHVVVKAITQDSVTLQDRDSLVEYTVLLSEEAPVQP